MSSWLGILNRHDELQKNTEDWAKARDFAEKRMPAYKRLQSLAWHAEGLDAATEAQPQIEAIAANRSLLDAADPVPDLANDTGGCATRRASVGGEAILRDLRLGVGALGMRPRAGRRSINRIATGSSTGCISPRSPKGTTGTEQEVLESVERISLDAWRTHTAALPQLFADARMQADKLIEPKTHHVKLGSATLRTPEEVKAWIAKTEQELLDQLKQGPIVVS